MSTAKQKVHAFAERMESLRATSTIGRFVFLDRTRFDLSPTLTILGCTLFSNVTEEQKEPVSTRLVDFRDIVDWTVSDHNASHASDLRWLNSQVFEIGHQEPQRDILVFTHHSPCNDPRANDPRHKNSEVTSGFVTDLGDQECWRNPAVKLWAFGHTHFNCDFWDENTGKRVAANQKGYYSFPQETFAMKKAFLVGK